MTKIPKGQSLNVDDILERYANVLEVVEAQLHELSHHPSVNDIEIRKLKRLKLKLKDQIEAH